MEIGNSQKCKRCLTQKLSPRWKLMAMIKPLVMMILLVCSQSYVQIWASGKTRVSTRIWRARVMGKRRADLRDQFLMGNDARALAARHLYCPEKKLWGYDARATWVNDARICGRNFLWEKTRASKFSKFLKIFKIFKIFKNFQKFSKNFKIFKDFQNFQHFRILKFLKTLKILKFLKIFKNFENFENF